MTVYGLYLHIYSPFTVPRIITDTKSNGKIIKFKDALQVSFLQFHPPPQANYIEVFAKVDPPCRLISES